MEKDIFQLPCLHNEKFNVFVADYIWKCIITTDKKFLEKEFILLDECNNGR